MHLKGSVAVVTGAASGIGEALVERFSVEGAVAVVAADRDVVGVEALAARLAGGPTVVEAVGCDVSEEAAVRDLVDGTVDRHGRLDLMVSNAGYVTVGGLEAPDEELRRMFDVHVMAHLYAARYAIPHMVANGGGHLLNTSSAAGLLTQIGSLHYSITKNSAVSLAEWISITYGDLGIGVSVLCPQAVDTNITANSPTAELIPGAGPSGAASVDGVLTAAELADTVVEALADGRFHVLPHPDVAEYVRRKGDDVDRWLAGMRRFQQRLFTDSPMPADWLLS
ncbi:MAG TPA: short-chain dehydrogenase [Acidimicrobiaceae bacterium]|mgnify:FL=1|nr:short-chain dehydrogenase [Acidimicrobiaceae bacterium]HAQ23137.1 short-chain dehydrogenase [Acidimicrobiaceae bacterium]HCV34705.1 short-chain dehydrogenase [Acidimicrobiaceae bacterium]|tara:strand:+ start:16494 stop:17336 length:843 start_codon:yes stop_codon:yes gene_type:complete